MRNPDRILIRTDLVTVGRFRCPVDHPWFRDSGPIRQSCIVFPRTAVVIEHAGTRPFVGDPALATLYNAGQQYERRAISPQGDHCDWYAVATGVLCDAVRPLDPAAADNPSRAMRHQHTPIAPALYLEQRRLFRSLERLVDDAGDGAGHGRVADASVDQLEVDERVISLLNRVLHTAYQRPATTDSPAAGGRARRQRAEIGHAAREVVARMFTERVTLAALARAVGCSPFHLCRSFREFTGSSVHAHLTALRLRTAIDHLEQGASITRVAIDAGFSSHSHFTAAFRQSFGVTPSSVIRM